MLLTKKTRNQLRKPFPPLNYTKKTLSEETAKDKEVVKIVEEVKEVEKPTKNTKKKNNKE